MPSNIVRKAARRKRQTRLTFEPVGSSSPAANMSPAHIRYEPVSKRATPASSLQQVADNEDEDSDDEVLGSAAKKEKGGLTVDTATGSGRRAGKRNIAKTLFKTLPTPMKSSQTRGDDSVGMFSEVNISFSSTNMFPGTLENESDDESDIQPPKNEIAHITPSKKQKSQPTRVPNKTKQPVVITLDSSDSEPEIYQPKSTRSRGTTGESSKRATRSTPTMKTVAPNRATRSKPVELPESDDELQLPVLENGKVKPKPKPKPAAKPKSVPKARKSSKPTFVEIESEVDEDDDPIVSSPKRSQRPLHKPRVESDSDEVRSSPLKRRRATQVLEDDEDEDDYDPVISPLKRSRHVAESDDSDDIAPSPMKRRRPVVDSDSDSDLPSINKLSRKEKGKERARSTSGPPETPMRTRAKTRRHRTAKEKQMELLRRRRAGENIEELTESESEEDDEDDFQKLDEFDDEEDSPDQVKKPPKAKVRRQRGDSSDEQAGESDFVIEDNDGPLGVPNYAHLMPLEFTQAAHKPLKEHFRDVVEWMVQNKLNPGFTWNDPVYNQAFQKLDNEYLGFADSKFVSTQWTAAFTRAVYARPTILISKLAPGEGIDVLGESKCEPCNHRNHHPSYALQFAGKAYHKATLEEIDSESDDSDDSDEDSDSDKASVNSKGQPLPSIDKIWMSGSVCKQNAEQAHTLIHWRWHLNDWVVGNLEEQGYLEPAKLAAREKLTTNKRMKLANSVVDAWGADRTIKNLYHDFKSQLETARELKAQARGGWK
ncbi:hypothetical protein BKA61DRAFT_28404 [Leptodontidium sp. MPI-SDFR-AT-0119]|nr:hypothetical protein BKA61DRAFT_28404 [Leptodontidium sp. MPI-SDFR-AT-0119]